MDTNLYDMLRQHLEREEGVRSVLYSDSEGVPTIGIGHNLRTPISQKAIDQIYADDVDVAFTHTRGLFYGYWETFSLTRQVALISMCFQLGLGGLQDFRDMIRAIQAGDWERAAAEALDSKWAKQTPGRAQRIAHMLLTGGEA